MKIKFLSVLLLILISATLTFISCGKPTFEEACQDLRNEITRAGYNVTYEVEEVNLRESLIITYKVNVSGADSREAAVSLTATYFEEEFKDRAWDLFRGLENCAVYLYVVDRYDSSCYSVRTLYMG